MRSLKQLITLIPFLALGACGSMGEAEKDAEPKTEEVLIGTVTMVSERGKFVTLRARDGVPPGDGVLISKSYDGTTANLRLSGERIGDSLAADIRSGTPRKGDAVFLFRRMSGADPSVSRMSQEKPQSGEAPDSSEGTALPSEGSE